MSADRAHLPELSLSTYVAPGRVLGKAFFAIGIAAFLIAVCFAINQYSYKAVLGVIGIGVGGLILWNPFIGLLVVVASLPFETAGMLGDPEAPGAISITKIGGLATFGAIILDLLLRRRAIHFERLTQKLCVLVCLLLAVTILSTVRHGTEESFRETVRFVTIVVFFFVTVLLVNSQERLRFVVLTWAVMATAVSGYSLVQRYVGPTVTSFEWAPAQLEGTIVDVSEDEVGVMVRSAGTFTHPGWLALYLAMATPFTLYMIWTAPRALIRTFWILALGVQAAAMFATYARTGYLAMAIGIALFLVRRRGGPAVLLWAGLLTAATWPMWPDTIQARVESILDYTKSSSSITRLGQQIVGWWMFRDNMATGVGPGNFEENVKTYIDRVPDKWRIEVIGAHNMYVEMLAELGIQGVLLMLMILFVGWRSAERARKRAREPAIALLYEAMSVSLIVFAFCATLLHARYQKEWWLLLAMIAAGSWISAQVRKAEAAAVVVQR